MRKIFSALLLIIALSNICFAAGLNDQGYKQQSLQNEIKRGSSAAISASPAGTYDPLVYADSVYKCLDKNIQDGTDTDGFRLGLYLMAWQFIDIKIKSATTNNLFDKQYIATATDQAIFFFKQFITYKEKLNLSEDEIGQAIGSSDSKKFSEMLKLKIEEWKTISTTNQ